MDLTESLPAHSSPDYVMPEPVAGFGYDGNKEVHSIMISYAPEHMNELSVAQHGRNSEVTSKGPALDSHPTITVDNTYLCPPSPISTRSDISCDAMMISAKSLDNDLWCKPPNHDELNEEQKAILSDYPSDLDTEYKSLYASFFRGILQWRSYVKWRYTRMLCRPTNTRLLSCRSFPYCDCSLCVNFSYTANTLAQTNIFKG